MSGGHFNYDQHRITGITEEISLLIRNNKKKDEYGFMRNYSHATIKKFKEAESVMRLAAMMVQRIDWLVCDDDGEDTFHERWDEDVRAIESLTARGRGLKQGGKMPQRDGTGPDGKGPKTGRGKGSCKTPKKPAKK